MNSLSKIITPLHIVCLIATTMLKCSSCFEFNFAFCRRYSTSARTPPPFWSSAPLCAIKRCNDDYMDCNDFENSSTDSILPKTGRREFIHSVLAFSTTFTWIGATGAAVAADPGKTSSSTIWMTGKAPKIPGQKTKDKGDLSGTKKDPGFLRAISNCKSQCEQRAGPDGLAKSKEECLSDCQDICCTTYEQCTFSIVPRI